MSKITNKHIIKIKELVSDEVCMGTFWLVELELLEMEKDFSEQLQNTSSNSDYAKCKHTKECKFHNGYLPVIADKTM